MHKTDTQTHGHQDGSHTDAGKHGQRTTERVSTRTRVASSRRGIQASRDKDRGEALVSKSLGSWGAQDPSPRTQGRCGYLWSDSSALRGSWKLALPIARGVASTRDAGEGCLVGTTSKTTGFSLGTTAPAGRWTAPPGDRYHVALRLDQLTPCLPLHSASRPLDVHAYTSVCTCTHMSTRVCTHARLRTCAPCVCTCACLWVRTCASACTRAQVYARVCMCTSVYVCMFACACLHVVCVQVAGPGPLPRPGLSLA